MTILHNIDIVYMYKSALDIFKFNINKLEEISNIKLALCHLIELVYIFVYEFIIQLLFITLLVKITTK